MININFLSDVWFKMQNLKILLIKSTGLKEENIARSYIAF